MHLDRDAGRDGLSGDPLVEGVGHDLVAAARVARGAQPVGLPAQRGVGGHPWATGRNPLSRDMVSGAGRSVTRRSFCAPRVRDTNACGSSR